jgi:RNA polymerase sigma-70 factor (ECF subfamily)
MDGAADVGAATPEPESDEALMQGYVAGDEAAFRVLFARYASFLMRLIRRQVWREADVQDLVQQTFLQVHRARRDFRAGMRLRPWLVTIALNLARDHLRRRGRRPETALEDAPEPVAPAPPEDDGTARLVREALAALPQDQRQVIELHWFDGLSFPEIATVVGARAGAVRVRAHRGYVALRRTLGAAADLPSAEE